MDTIYKVFENCEVKKLGERQYEFVASTADMDRDGEIIDVEGWDLKNFKKNPIIMYAHDYRTLPIGKAIKIGISDGKLKNTIEFPPEGTYEFADIVERLVGTGYLKTESVGFIPRKWEDGDGEKGTPRRTYTKQELLEISIVPIPSNPNAIREAVEAGVITTKQFEAITKPEETDEYIRIPVDRGNHEGHRIRTITISDKEGIKAIYCGECKKVLTYLFAKDKGWTMEKARAWVKEHEGKSLDELMGRSISQEGILDELDYLIRLIDTEGMNDEVKNDAWHLVREVMRLTGGDIPDDIKSLILKENKAITPPAKTPITKAEIIQIVKGAVVEAIATAQGKV